LLKSKKSYRFSIRHKAQSIRQLKVARMINILLVECLRRETRLDLRLFGKVSISIIEVNMSVDLKVANCFFIPFNTDLTVNELLDALEKSKYVIRHYVTKKAKLKFSPEIRFYYDQEYT